MPDRVNPYNFVSFGPQRTGALADGPPPNHDRVQSGTVHGTITVTFRAATPLLVLDDSTKTTSDVDDHWTYRTRVDAQGNVLIPPTAIKGMLRSAHEAVTNSRMGAFSEHTVRLGYRLRARAGAGLTPARVALRDGQLVLQLLDGVVDDRRANDQRFVKPAFVPVNLVSRLAQAVGGQPMDLHGKVVQAIIRPVRHRNFEGWRVTALRRGRDDEFIKAADLPPNGRWQYANGAEETVNGYLFLTGAKSARNKHEERLFFSTVRPDEVPLDESVDAMWRDVMRSYEDVHDLKPEGSLKADGGPQPGVNFAAHLTRADRRRLGEGTLLYVRTQGRGANRTIVEVHPVAIGRKLFDRPPRALAPAHVLPVQRLAEASASDRLFGFVSASKSAAFEDQAHRGALRVVAIDTGGVTLTALGQADAGEPLSILGSPKPQQARFYLGAQAGGGTTPLNKANGDAYKSQGQVLRGRKFFWHHPTDTPTPGGRTWRSDSRTNQNRSITDWIEIGSHFTVTMTVRDCRRADLGALVWLLRQAQGDTPAHLRCGLAKPLGFGSLKVTDIRFELTGGKEAIDALQGLRRATPQHDLADELEREFRAAVEVAGSLPQHLNEYLAMARGDTKGVTVGYPRNEDQDNGYDWFMANAEADYPQALPLATDKPPSLRPSEQGQRTGGQGGGSRQGGQHRPGPRGGGPPRPRRNQR